VLGLICGREIVHLLANESEEFSDGRNEDEENCMIIFTTFLG
jgi:hypothetical protein